MGRPSRAPAPTYSAEEAAQRLRMPLAVLLRRLESPGSRFFPGARRVAGADGADGAEGWQIPERDLSAWCGRGLPQLYTTAEAAEALRVTVGTIQERVRAWRAGDTARGIRPTMVWEELRITEEELARHIRPEADIFTTTHTRRRSA